MWTQKVSIGELMYSLKNTVSYDLIDNPEILYEGGLAFGRFQSMLADYPAKNTS